MSDDYFTQLNEILKAHGDGLPHIVLDLDRLDHNSSIIRQEIGADRIRLVDKSLPSPGLLAYLAGSLPCNRLMAFHPPFVPLLYDALPGAAVMMGKPVLPATVAGLINEDRAAAARLQWLADTRESLAELVAAALRHDCPLQVNLEIDIGLHRGGVDSFTACEDMLASLIVAGDAITLTGLMGYEAHVPYYPEPAAAFERAMNRLADYRDHIEQRLGQPLAVINAGGSTTLSYHRETWVSDVAVGSAFVDPAAVTSHAELLPALHIAAPILKRLTYQGRNPVPAERQCHLYTYGGGWAAAGAWPPGVTISAHADPPNQNLLPNQCLFETRIDNPVTVGDHLFFQPMQGDALFQFEDILVLRDGKILDTWHPFRRRF